MSWFNKKNGDYLTEIVKSVTKTETNVEHLKDSFKEHSTAGYEQRKLDKIWQSNIETKIDKCPERNRIDEIEISVHTKMNEDAGKVKVWKLIAAVITLIATMIIIVVNLKRLWALPFMFWLAVATGYASECPVKNKNIQEIVEVFNNYIVSRDYGLSFECNNPEDASPVLECYTPLTTEQCIDVREQLKALIKGMSIDWNIYTNNKEVNVYDVSNKLIYFIDRDGKFRGILDDVI